MNLDGCFNCNHVSQLSSLLSGCWQNIWSRLTTCMIRQKLILFSLTYRCSQAFDLHSQHSFLPWGYLPSVKSFNYCNPQLCASSSMHVYFLLRTHYIKKCITIKWSNDLCKCYNQLKHAMNLVLIWLHYFNFQFHHIDSGSLSLCTHVALFIMGKI